VIIGILALVLLLISILSNGLSSFRRPSSPFRSRSRPSVSTRRATATRPKWRRVTTFGYLPIIAQAFADHVESLGIEHEVGLREMAAMISEEAPAQLRARVLANPDLVGQTIDIEVLAGGRIDGYFKGRVTMASAERDNNVTPEQLVLAQALADAGSLDTRFNLAFITAPDASGQRPEAAGLGVAIVGSFYMMLVVLALALPIGVAASIYLEEFAPKNRFTDLIEVNISNLAAVPSIVFGILGLATFINFAGACRNRRPGRRARADADDAADDHHRHARRASRRAAVDPRGALGVGASKMQACFTTSCRWRPRHPDRHDHRAGAGPGRNRAAAADRHGGLRPRIPDAPPEGLFDPATALPVQVYSWTQRSDPGLRRTGLWRDHRACWSS
jgi:phosphate transport system permease protein